MRVAIIGIQGLPNTYGGFETLAENLVVNLSTDFQIAVYCSSRDMKRELEIYKGARLIYIPITSHGSFGILYDSLSLLRSINQFDKILILGFGCGFVMPFIKKHHSKIIVNIGGLDWKRNKWSWFAQKVIYISENLLLKYSGFIISDNVGIQQYIFKEYKRQSALIAYGGDQAIKQECSDVLKEQYPFLRNKYALSVSRIQSDNNIEMILESFTDESVMPLVMIGNWQSSSFGRQMKKRYGQRSNLILLEGIYDRKILDCFRSNCTIYIHGHSAGGTNPSLVEAMYLELLIFAFASGYNEYTTENAAVYFQNKQQLAGLLRTYQSLDALSIKRKLKEIAERSYKWSNIAARYKEIFLD